MKRSRISKSWVSPMARLVLCVILVVAVVSSFVYDKLKHRIIWVSPVRVSAAYLQGKMTNTASDYLGVFEYTDKIPVEVREVANTCRSSTLDLCYRAKDYYLYQDLSRVRYHIQNLCEYTVNNDVSKAPMKVTASCPIVDSNQLLRGYVLYTSMLNVSETDVIIQLRTIANDIGSNM